MGTEFKERAPLVENVVSQDVSARINPENLRQDDSTETKAEKNYSVGLFDIDEALGYFFNNVLKPTVIQEGQVIPVPVIYGSPERWSTMKQQGYFRDGKSKLVLPLIMYRRVSVGRNESLYFPRLKQLYYISSRKWDSKNKYSDYQLLPKLKNNLDSRTETGTDRYSLTYLPNHIIINYEGIIWTAFNEQLNKLIEKIAFHDGTYWGDPNKFKFKTEVDGFDTAVELNTGNERLVKCNFSITLYGYILPEEVQGKLTTNIGLSPKKIIFIENEIK